MTGTREAPLLRLLVGEALRGYRSAQGRTLRDVATAARVSVPYLSEVERGRKEASSEVLAAVCRGLDLPLSDLLEQVRRELVTREARQRDGAERELVPVARPSQLPAATAPRAALAAPPRQRPGIGFVPGPPLRLVRAATSEALAAEGLALIGGADDAEGLTLVRATDDAARPAAELPDATIDAAADAVTDGVTGTAADGESTAAGPTCLADGPHSVPGGHSRPVRRRPGQGRPDGPGQLRAPIIPLPHRTAIVA